MKKLKLFPKTFLYTLALMLFIIVTAHVLIFFLAPQMQLELSTADHVSEHIVFSVNETKIIAQAIQKALPVSLITSLFISIICSLLFSKIIADPIKKISELTERMMKLDRAANCHIHTKDEIGVLANNVNKLYSDLLATIENLEREKDTVRNMERSKSDFLRAASHELKTPVTALSAVLENMMLGVGKYRDHGLYLPKCKEITDNLSKMIYDILETSKLNNDHEELDTVEITELTEEICVPYQMIAAAHGISFSLDLSVRFNSCLSVKHFKKALSNIAANAVQYTEKGKKVSVYTAERSIIVENECVPIPDKEIKRLFEPFYRSEFSRDKETGGNGLGLYIADTIFKSMDISYSFEPMSDLSGMRFTIIL